MTDEDDEESVREQQVKERTGKQALGVWLDSDRLGRSQRGEIFLICPSSLPSDPRPSTRSGQGSLALKQVSELEKWSL